MKAPPTTEVTSPSVAAEATPVAKSEPEAVLIQNDTQDTRGACKESQKLMDFI